MNIYVIVLLHVWIIKFSSRSFENGNVYVPRPNSSFMKEKRFMTPEKEVPYYGMTCRHLIVSKTLLNEWFLSNTIWLIFQLLRGKNNRWWFWCPLCTRPTKLDLNIANSLELQCTYTHVPPLDTFFWIRANQYLPILYFTFLFSLCVFVSAAGQYSVIWTGTGLPRFRFGSGTVSALLF